MTHECAGGNWPGWGRRAFLLLSICLAACGGGSGGGTSESVAPGPADPADYFPLPTNARWLSADGLLARVSGPDPAAGANALRVHSSQLGQIREETYRVSSSAIVQVGSRSTNATNRAIGDMLVLRLPVRTGDSWVMYDTVVDGLLDPDRDGRPDRVSLRAVATVVGYEAVDVPAGRFERALKVRVEDQQTARLADGGREVSGTVITESWYVADIGRVRSVSTQVSPAIELGRSELRGYRVGALRTDTVAPTVVESSLLEGQVVNTTRIEVGFSEVLDLESAAVPISVVGSAGAPLRGAARWDGSARRLVFELDSPIATGAYRVALDPGLTDSLGNPIEGGLAWNVTLDFTGPAIVSASPAAQAAGVAIGSDISLVLDEPATALDISLSRAGQPVFGRLIGSGRQWRFIPERPLFRAARYEVSVAATDQAGNRTDAMSYSFTTEVGRFDALAAPAAAAGSRHLAAADVDGDGRSDVVVLTTGGEFLLLRQRADASFETLSIGSAGVFETGFSLLDLDGDGRLDLLPRHAGNWWRQKPDGSFESRELVSPGFGLSDVRVLRRASGRLDVIGSMGFQAKLVRQIVPGSFGPLEDLVNIPSGTALFVGDVDGDGLTDIITPTFIGGAASLVIHYQQPDGSFGPSQVIVHGGELQARSVSVADLDGDGRADIVLTVASSGAGIVVVRQTAAGVFARPVVTDATGGELRVLDIDGDGRLDLLSASPGQLVLHMQRADGSFAPGEAYFDSRFSPPTDEASSFAVGDLDADGRPDVMAGGVLWRQRRDPAVATRDPPGGPILIDWTRLLGRRR